MCTIGDFTVPSSISYHDLEDHGKRIWCGPWFQDYLLRRPLSNAKMPRETSNASQENPLSTTLPLNKPTVLLPAAPGGPAQLGSRLTEASSVGRRVSLVSACSGAAPWAPGRRSLGQRASRVTLPGRPPCLRRLLRRGSATWSSGPPSTATASACTRRRPGPASTSVRWTSGLRPSPAACATGTKSSRWTGRRSLDGDTRRWWPR